MDTWLTELKKNARFVFLLISSQNAIGHFELLGKRVKFQALFPWVCPPHTHFFEMVYSSSL